MDKSHGGIEKSISSTFYDEIKTIIINTQNAAIRSIDFQRVMMYWHLGERIFIEEQCGKDHREKEVIELSFNTNFDDFQFEYIILTTLAVVFL